MNEINCPDCFIEVNPSDLSCRGCGCSLPNATEGNYHNVEQWHSHITADPQRLPHQNPEASEQTRFPPESDQQVAPSKPDEMSIEQWIDYQRMNEKPGKTVQTMTGSEYRPSKEEIAYVKKWKSEYDKAVESRKFGDSMVKWILISLLTIFLLALFG